jgi:hypothetical protein
VLEDVGDTVHHECRHRRRTVGEPALPLLADHHRFERDSMCTEELLGQPADGSAGM